MPDATAANVEPIGFTCTQADFLDAQRLHHTLNLSGRRFLIRLAAWTVSITVVLAVVSSVVQRSTGLEALGLSLTFAAFYLCLMAVLILVNRLVVLPRAARRQLSQLKEFAGPLIVGVSSPRIVLTTTHGSSEVPTEDFLKWAENGKSILLYRADGQFNLIPKRVVSEAFYRSLVAELTRARVSKAGFSNS